MVAEQPSSQGLINEKRKEIFENWEELTQRADSRKTNLEQSRELQRFLADLRDLVSVSRSVVYIYTVCSYVLYLCTKNETMAPFHVATQTVQIELSEY